MKERYDISCLPAGLPVVVTGATGGIGTEIALALASLGVPMILPCRNEKKYETLRERILAAYPAAQISYVALDLNRAQSVRDAAAAIAGKQLAGIVNNAGIMCRHFTLSADGSETTLNVNYFNTRLFNELLLPQIAHGGALVFTTSVTRKAGHTDVLPEEVTEKDFSQLGTYGLSKKLITRYALALAPEAAAYGVRVNCADPGIVNSGMITMHRWYDPLANIFFRPFIRPARKGAVPALRALFSPLTARIFTLRHIHRN